MRSGRRRRRRKNWLIQHSAVSTYTHIHTSTANSIRIDFMSHSYVCKKQKRQSNHLYRRGFVLHTVVSFISFGKIRTAIGFVPGPNGASVQKAQTYTNAFDYTIVSQQTIRKCWMNIAMNKERSKSAANMYSYCMCMCDRWKWWWLCAHIIRQRIHKFRTFVRCVLDTFSIEYVCRALSASSKSSKTVHVYIATTFGR